MNGQSATCGTIKFKMQTPTFIPQKSKAENNNSNY